MRIPPFFTGADEFSRARERGHGLVPTMETRCHGHHTLVASLLTLELPCEDSHV
jgi:hypothetical protein